MLPPIEDLRSFVCLPNRDFDGLPRELTLWLTNEMYRESRTVRTAIFGTGAGRSFALPTSKIDGI